MLAISCCVNQRGKAFAEVWKGEETGNVWRVLRRYKLLRLHFSCVSSPTHFSDQQFKRHTPYEKRSEEQQVVSQRPTLSNSISNLIELVMGVLQLRICSFPTTERQKNSLFLRGKDWSYKTTHNTELREFLWLVICQTSGDIMNK